MSNAADHPTLLVRGGRVFDPVEETDRVADVAVAGGRIVAALPGPADITVEAAGSWVCPGFVEPHAAAPAAGVGPRFARQALAGGYTTVAAFGTARRSRGYDGPCPRLLRIAPLTRPGERRLAELGDAAEAGAVAFGDGPEPHGDAELLRRGLLYAGMLGKPVFDLPRDPVLSEGGVAHEGPVAASQGLFGVSVASETVALRRAATLAAAAGGRLHFTGLSSLHAVEEMAEELDRRRDRPPTFAVSAAHLLCTAETLRGFDPAGRVDPPFRDPADRDALVAVCLSRGSLAVAVTSGHRPDPGLLDPVDLLAAPPGYEAFETAASAAFTAFGGDFPALARLLTAGPAGVLGLTPPAFSVGSPADIVVFDPDAERSCDPAALAVPVARTPLAGRALRGRVTHTVLGGRVVFQNGTFPRGWSPAG